jgi:hypothetical protein
LLIFKPFLEQRFFNTTENIEQLPEKEKKSMALSDSPGPLRGTRRGCVPSGEVVGTCPSLFPCNGKRA